MESNLSTEVAKSISRECDIGGDGIFTNREIVSCFTLASNVEYVILKLLKDNHAILDVYGTCGTLYTVQYASSNVFFDPLSDMSDQRSWAVRAKVVIALLNMVWALEITPFGSLHLCTIDRANIGIVS